MTENGTARAQGLTRLVCLVVQRRATGAAVGAGWVERHVAGCGRCLEARAAFTDVEAGLSALAAAARDETAGAPLRPQLRTRITGAFHQQIGTRDSGLDGDPAVAFEASSAGALKLGWLGRSVCAAGVFATLTIGGSVLWTRLDDFRPPPRVVRIEVPNGYRATADLSVVIKRASGAEERR